jgi:hypothetical protein
MLLKGFKGGGEQSVDWMQLDLRFLLDPQLLDSRHQPCLHKALEIPGDSQTSVTCSPLSLNAAT